MIITSDSGIFEDFKSIIDINLIESKSPGEFQLNPGGVTTVEISDDRKLFDEYVEIISLSSRPQEVNYNYKVIKKKIINLNNLNSFKLDTDVLTVMTNFYEISDSIEFPFDDISKLGLNHFKNEFHGEYRNRCIELFKGEKYYLLKPFITNISFYEPYNYPFPNLKSTDFNDKIIKVFNEIMEIGKILERANKNFIIGNISSYLEQIATLNEDYWDQQNKQEENLLDIMFEESENEMKRWDEEDGTWRVANDLD
jgi:hypothetical protein